MTYPSRSVWHGVYRPAFAAGVLLALAGAPALAQAIYFDTEMVQMDLTGGPFPMPLASDPGNSLGDSVDGYGFVDSLVTITLSSQRPTSPGAPSLGQSVALLRGIQPAPGPPPVIDPGQLDGELFFVDSFFDVFFDITVTDVDSRPGRDFAGQPAGASLPLLDNGPAHMTAQHQAIFDKDAPNFGLVPPPEADPFVGGFGIEIPLGGDINGNGENDKIKFNMIVNSVGDQNRIFITMPDGTVLNMFASAAFLEGAVVDESTDPPFTIGAMLPGTPIPDPSVFGGPTVVNSTLVNDVVPEPTTLALGLVGLVLLARRRRHA
jgi:hypothetical protein